MALLTCAMYGAKIIFGNTAMDVLRESGSGNPPKSYKTISFINLPLLHII